MLGVSEIVKKGYSPKIIRMIRQRTIDFRRNLCSLKNFPLILSPSEKINIEKARKKHIGKKSLNEFFLKLDKKI